MIDYNVIQQLRNNLMDGETRESREHPGTRELGHPTSTDETLPLVAGRATLERQGESTQPFKVVRSTGGGGNRQISNARIKKKKCQQKRETVQERQGRTSTLEGCFQGYIKDEVREK